MDTMRVLVLWLPRAWGLGAVRMVAARPPLVPSACHLDQRVTWESNEDLLLANSRLSRRLLSLSPHAPQLAVLVIWLVSGSLPYFSGVRASGPNCRRPPSDRAAFA